MNEELINTIKAAKVIPIATIEADDAPYLAEALLGGGIKVVEVTLRTRSALSAIKIIREKFPNLMVCAGTVIDIEQLRAAMNEGASFAVAPGFDPQVVGYSQTKKYPYIPGICTPTELQIAISMGVKAVKFFPAEPLGGAKTLKVLTAPFQHLNIKYLPTGAITGETIRGYLALPYVIACGGSWIVKDDEVKQKKWNHIKDTAAQAVSLVNE